MSKLSRFVRFRGTAMEGMITKRLIHNGEVVYKVVWGWDEDEDPRPYRPDDLESLPREDRQNLQIIKQANCADRKQWEERMIEYGTVEGREQFRNGTFERV